MIVAVGTSPALPPSILFTVLHSFSPFFIAFHSFSPPSTLLTFSPCCHYFSLFSTLFHCFSHFPSLLVLVLPSALVERVSVFCMQDFSYLLLFMSQKVSFWCKTNIHPKADETEALNHQFESCPRSNHTCT